MKKQRPRPGQAESASATNPRSHRRAERKKHTKRAASSPSTSTDRARCRASTRTAENRWRQGQVSSNPAWDTGRDGGVSRDNSPGSRPACRVVGDTVFKTNSPYKQPLKPGQNAVRHREPPPSEKCTRTRTQIKICIEFQGVSQIP